MSQFHHSMSDNITFDGWIETMLQWRKLKKAMVFGGQPMD